jgi:outer membrane protein OmpA-like peptidoglycan-associated protein
MDRGHCGDRQFRLVDPSGLPSVLFAFGQYVLPEPRRQALERHASWLRAHPGVRVRLVGVCEAQESGQETSALLAYRRQLSVKNGLVQLGIAPDRLVVKFEEPSEIAGRVADRLDPGANRRVDFVESP